MIGIALLLGGMWIVNLFVDGILSSFIDIIPMVVALYYIASSVGINRMIGKKLVYRWLLLILVLAVFSLSFSCFFVFNDYLNGISNDVTTHEEHAWGYESMASIAESIKIGDLNQTLESLHLGKYQTLFVVYSLMFVFGGTVVTHICIWNSFFVGLCCVLLLLIAGRENYLSENNKQALFLITALFPIFHCGFIYHRDIIGVAFVVLGFYLFISTYKSAIASIVSFPLYSLLFYHFRHPYIIVAFLLFLFGLVSRKNKGLITLFSFVVLLFAVVYFLYNENLTSFFSEDLYFDAYGSQYHGSLIGTILQAIVGYFPWTQLITDKHWTYHVFICLQQCMQLSIIFFFINEYQNKLGDILKKPVPLMGVLLFSTALISAGHVAYFSVAFPFLAICINNLNIRKVYSVFIIVFSFFFITSIVYNMLGYTGSGIIN